MTRKKLETGRTEEIVRWDICPLADGCDKAKNARRFGNYCNGNYDSCIKFGDYQTNNSRRF